jgi:glutamyl-tRNA reductase
LSTPSIVVVGSNHVYATVDIRERLAFVGETLTDGLRALNVHVGEGFILSTCNRTEIYATSSTPEHGHQEILEFLSRYHSVPLHVLDRASYVLHGQEAVEHLFRVASGLDSMVLGEPQILSQIRDALESARQAESVGPALQRLATDALRIGKKARTETDIARNRNSIAHAAIDLITAELGNVQGLNAVVIGAGNMASLAAKLLHARGMGKLTIVNRSQESAQQLASSVEAGVLPLSGISYALDRADVAIAAVSADQMVVTPDVLRRREKPLLLVDLSVPRAVDRACEVIEQVAVRDVDALESLAEAARSAYASEVAKVEHLVQTAVSEFDTWMRSRLGARVIGGIQQRAAEARDQELDKALRKLAHLNERDQNVVRAMAHGISNKLIHQPISTLRETDSIDVIRQTSRLFGIHDITDERDATPTRTGEDER